MDVDGQYFVNLIFEFMVVLQVVFDVMIFGQLVFDVMVLQICVYGWCLFNGCVDIEILWVGIGDMLFGFCVYLIVLLVEIMCWYIWMCGFDFDLEVVVCLCWVGVCLVWLVVLVCYFCVYEGGVLYFWYLCDNILLVGMYLCLVVEGMLCLFLMIV